MSLGVKSVDILFTFLPLELNIAIVIFIDLENFVDNDYL